LAKAVAFIAGTPAKSALLLVGPMRRTDWEPFRLAMLKFKDLTVQVPRSMANHDHRSSTDADMPINADLLGLPNVVAAASRPEPAAPTDRFPSAAGAD
jgi:hypothetical protein